MIALHAYDPETREAFAVADLEQEASECPSFVGDARGVLWRHPDGRGWIRWDIGLARSVLALKTAEPLAWEAAHRAELTAAIKQSEAYHRKAADVHA